MRHPPPRHPQGRASRPRGGADASHGTRGGSPVLTPPTEIPLFPLNVVLFPGARLPLRIFEERYKRLFEDSLRQGTAFGIVLIREGQEVGGPATPFDVGTLAEIEAVDHHKDSIFLLCRGTRRFRIQELRRDRPYLVGRVQILPEGNDPTPDEASAAAALAQRFGLYLERMKGVARMAGGELQVPPTRTGEDARSVAYGIAAALPLDLTVKQALLEEAELSRFLGALRARLDQELDFLTPTE